MKKKGPDLAGVRDGATVAISPSQRRGLKYQAKVEEEILRCFPVVDEALLRPWFRYKRAWDVHRCQPDVLLRFDQDDPLRARIVIVEIKLSTIPEAWNQLQLYKSVVEKAYRVPAFCALITKAFDPHRIWPCEITQLEGLDRLRDWRGEGLGVISLRL